MSRIVQSSRNQGHRVDIPGGTDIDQRLTYQQLLRMNHDYAKENLFLKNNSKVLGEKLRDLHTLFQIKPREVNAQVYEAIDNHPHIHAYENVLVPLFECYENKMQVIEENFELLHGQFFRLEIKYEEACKQNEKLNMKLTECRTQLINIYRNGNSEEMHSSFGQLILDQVNQRQKFLVEENAKLERELQNYKSQAEKKRSQLQSARTTLEKYRSQNKQYQISLRQHELEINNLKENSFELQLKANELEAEKRKLEQAHERAQSQNNTLNKEKGLYMNKLEQFKSRMEKENQMPMDSDQRKFIEQLQTEIAFLKAEKGPSDTHKKLTKLQRDYESLTKEKNRLKDALDTSKIREDELNESIAKHRSAISKLEAQKTALELNQNKITRSLETLTEKSKSQIIRLKKSNSEDLQKLQFDLKHKIDLKDSRINQLEDKLEKVTLEKQKIQKELSINDKNDKHHHTKDSERALTKLKEKLSINEELFKQQIQIFQNDLSFLKKENDSLKVQNKQKTGDLQKIKSEHQNLHKKYEDISKEKASLLQEFRKVRDEYEIHLKDKERIFQQKIRQIKAVVQDSDNRRRAQRQRVQEATREYKRVLEDIKSAYEARIRELQSQNITQTRYRAETYTATPAH